jgi:hypothetical protein
MLDHLYYFKSDLDQQGIFFCFSGPMSQTLLMEVGDTLRNKMAKEQTSPSTILKVFAMFIEQVQNIIRYSAEEVIFDESSGGLRNGIVVVGYENGHYYVLCGNMVENEDVSFLSEQLQKLQIMNKEQLKTYYKEQRKKAPHEKSKGAGLGFIELARRSVTPIQFDFRNIDEKHSFFSLKTEI